MPNLAEHLHAIDAPEFQMPASGSRLDNADIAPLFFVVPAFTIASTTTQAGRQAAPAPYACSI